MAAGDEAGSDTGGDGAGSGEAAFEETAQNLQMSFAKMMQTHSPQSWSDLPSELADMVLRRLPSHADRVRFAAVCHHWRFSRVQTRALPAPTFTMACIL